MSTQDHIEMKTAAGEPERVYRYGVSEAKPTLKQKWDRFVTKVDDQFMSVRNIVYVTAAIVFIVKTLMG